MNTVVPHLRFNKNKLPKMIHIDLFFNINAIKKFLTCFMSFDNT